MVIKTEGKYDMKICPRCGGDRFIVRVILDQSWLVDGNGNKLSVECSDLVSDFDNGELICAECGHVGNTTTFEAKKSEFDVTITYSTSKTFHVEAYDYENAVDVASEQLDSEELPIGYVVEDEDGVIEEGMF